MKKTESITLRCTPELKAKLQIIADEKKWTLSQTAVVILEEYIKENNEKDKQ